MKKFILALVVSGLFLMGCKMGVETFFPWEPVPEIPESSPVETSVKTEKNIENLEPSYIYENEVLNPSVNNGNIVYSGDKYNGTSILTVIPTYEGLKIIKNHSPEWKHNTIHVINRSNGKNYENMKIDDVNESTNELLYPFVNAGDIYEVYIEKQEEGWTNWGVSQSVTVTAVGGIGDCTVVYSKYAYNHRDFTLTFKDLTFVCPEQIKSVYKYFEGPVFQGKLWNSASSYAMHYRQDKSKIYFENDTDFIKNQDVVSISLNYRFEYKNLKYVVTVLSQEIFNKENSRTIFLNGGVKIPSVYLNGYAGWEDGTAKHFGENWTDSGVITIRIYDENDSSNNLETTAVRVKDRGNSTRWNAKVPYSLKFETKTKVLGMPKSKRWVLMANYFDRSLIRTQFAGFLGNNVFNSYWNAEFKPVNLYINGNFMGTYDLGECNKVEKNRVNIQSLEDYAEKSSDYADVNGDGKVDINDAGFIVEIDTDINKDGKINRNNYKNTVGMYSGAERNYFYSSEYCIPFTLKDPDFGDNTKFSDADCQKYTKYAASKINAFEKMLVKNDFAVYYKDYIDVYSFADWYLINEFAKNSDANFQKSIPVTYNPATGKLYMGPNWDFDLGFGNFDHGYELIGGGYSYADDPTGWYIHGGKKGCDENALRVEINGSVVQSWWINRLFEAKSFKQFVKNRWMVKRIELKNAINEKIIEYANRINDYIPQNEQRLHRLGVQEWNGPSGYADRTEYGDEIYYFYNWCLKRFEWMDAEISKW